MYAGVAENVPEEDSVDDLSEYKSSLFVGV